MKIKDGLVVSFHYTLRDAMGEILEVSMPERPLTYLHGAEQLLAGLERALDGHEAQDALTIVLAPSSAYGERDESEEREVPAGSFPEHIVLRPGIPFQANAPDGQVLTLWVTKVQGDQVWVTHQHPLAGRTLRYDVHIIEVREPSEGERAVGRVVAPGFGLSEYRANE